MTSAVKRTFDRRGARAKAQSSPPCSFIRLITPRIAEQFHHLKLTLKLSRQWGALHLPATETEKLFNDESSRRLPQQIQRVARRKLLVLHQARNLNDLRVPYGNHLEALKDDRKGQHSIRVNDQWRICFRWHGEDAFDVEIVDYH
jgi:proteic killer suppression protein